MTKSRTQTPCGRRGTMGWPHGKTGTVATRNMSLCGTDLFTHQPNNIFFGTQIVARLETRGANRMLIRQPGKVSKVVLRKGSIPACEEARLDFVGTFITTTTYVRMYYEAINQIIIFTKFHCEAQIDKESSS